jgi:1-acyl-sn-glycerol-3-phosphate acyltransferase
MTSVSPQQEKIDQGSSIVVGPSVPRRGNWLSQKSAQAVLRLSGWRIEGEIPDLPKFVLVGAPHTSNWDYILTVLTIGDLQADLHYVIKHSMIEGPFGGIIAGLGGISVDRSTTEGFVDKMVAEFNRHEKYILAIMPTGTRNASKEWRSGFYYIAREANVPVVLVIFDYGNKVMRLGPTIELTGDYQSDLAYIRSFYEGVQGKNMG